MDGKSITIRDCAVDSGSLTADTEIIRLICLLNLLVLTRSHVLRYLHEVFILVHIYLLNQIEHKFLSKTGFPTVVPSTLVLSTERSMFEDVS